MDLSLTSSQNTPGGTGRHCDPMFARTSASLLLDLLTCFTLHPSNVPSRSLYASLYATKLSLTASPNIFRRVAPHAFTILIPCSNASYTASLFDAFWNVI